MTEDIIPLETEENEHSRKKHSRVASLAGTLLSKKTTSSPKGRVSIKYKNMHATILLSPQSSTHKMNKLVDKGKNVSINRLFSPKQSNKALLIKNDQEDNSNSPKVLSQSVAGFPDVSPKRNGKIVTQMLMQTVDCVYQQSKIPKLEPARVSPKEMGMIKAYSANTHQGIIRYKINNQVF